MKKLQASMKDSSFTRNRQYRGYYKVGSYFKGCQHCGEVVWVQCGDREVKRYLSGYDVFRSYQPQSEGWTYWCWTCGAKDMACWEDAENIGQDAIRGTRDAIAAHKKYAIQKKKLLWKSKAKVVVTTAEELAKAKLVTELEAEVAKLKALIAKEGK